MVRFASRDRAADSQISELAPSISTVNDISGCRYALVCSAITFSKSPAARRKPDGTLLPDPTNEDTFASFAS